jgi:hypothetical protein
LRVYRFINYIRAVKKIIQLFEKDADFNIKAVCKLIDANNKNAKAVEEEKEKS